MPTAWIISQGNTELTNFIFEYWDAECVTLALGFSETGLLVFLQGIYKFFRSLCSRGTVQCSEGAEPSEKPSARIVHHIKPNTTSFAALPTFIHWQSLSWERPYLQCSNTMKLLGFKAFESFIIKFYK